MTKTDQPKKCTVWKLPKKSTSRGPKHIKKIKLSILKQASH